MSHTFNYAGFFSTWHQSDKKYNRDEPATIQAIPIMYRAHDPILHTADHPFCSDPDCPCHQENDLAWAVCWQPVFLGLLTPSEAARIFYGRQV